MDFNEANFVISKAEVNEGTNVKKLKPRARGRNYLIKRPTCHITIVLTNIALSEFYEEYEDSNISLKKSRWKTKNKSTDTTFHNML
jgi:large subunit ribosomal protein L22